LKSTNTGKSWFTAYNLGSWKSPISYFPQEKWTEIKVADCPEFVSLSHANANL